MYDTYTEAVEAFLKNADWLGDEEAPMVTSLIVMARQLDKRFSAATMAQFGLSYRFLAKKAPQGDDVRDPLEALLGYE